jgi:competence protein ComEC
MAGAGRFPLIVIGFTAGVLLTHALPELPPLWALAAVVLVPAIFPWRGRVLWCAVIGGIILTTWRAQGPLDQRWPAARHGEDVSVQGAVASLPERESRNENGNWRFLFEPEGAENPALPQRIRVSWYRADQIVRGGECWRFTLRLRTPHGSLNPGGFDYEGWLFRQGIGATATVRDAERCDTAQRRPILEWRQQLVDEVRHALPEHPALGLLTALAVGDDSGFSNADWDAFRATGTSHLVAISGFNIAIVAGVAYFLFRWLWSAFPALCLRLPAQRAGLLSAAVFAWFYALLAGFEPPVQRAVLMLWIVLAALWMHRPGAPSRVLGLAWIAVLLLDPFAITSPGLWLSFGAVAAIFYVSLGRLRAPGVWHGLVWLQLLLAVALAPLTLYFFQGASWIAPFVNLLAVPLFMVLTPWVLAAVLVYLLSPVLGLPLLASAAKVLQWFRAGLEYAAQLPDLWLPASPPFAALLLALLGVALLFAPRGLPLRPLGALCLLPMLLAAVSPPRGGFELTVLDVGQGLAVVVRIANHTLLYDAGPAFEDGFDAGESVVAPYLLDQGLRRIDLLFLSHGDNDHSGGVPSVRKLMNVAAEVGTENTARCADTMAWTWDAVRFEVLHPDAAPGASAGDHSSFSMTPADGDWSENNGSCVLKIEGGGFSVLLAGDIEKAAEQRLLSGHRERLKSDVLIAPHHGSKTSSTAEFVQAVQPGLVIYGAGWRNHFRHPRPEVIARYGAIGARQYVTGNGGAISVWSEEGVLRVEEWRREAARFWNAQAEELR